MITLQHMKILILVVITLLVGAFGDHYGERAIMRWKLSRTTLKFSSDPTLFQTFHTQPIYTRCSTLLIVTHSLESKPTSVDIGCDGQVKIEGPRDEASQLFWDNVIRMTPPIYLTPRRAALELTR